MNHLFLFLNMSGGEILVIVAVAYIILGPKKIPELARMVGKGINELRRATDDIKNEFTKEMNKVKRDVDINLKDPFMPDVYKENSNGESDITRKREEDQNKPEAESDIK
jgi:Tat protein translocase TatB subunit